MRLLRLGLVIVSLVAAAWFAVGARQAHDVDQLTVMLNHRLSTAAQRSRAHSLLDSAAFLYPGQDVPILRARVAFYSGQRQRGEQLVARAAHAEPQNLNAWTWVAGFDLANPHRAGLKAAEAHLAALDPVDLR